MVSKYNIYWLSIIEDIHNGILEAMTTNECVNINVQNITNCGKRNKWYGYIEVSSRGINGGEMAHAMSLGKVIMGQDFLKDMNNKRIKLKISNSLNLEIEVDDESIKRDTETITQTPIKHKSQQSFDKTTITQQSTTEKIYSFLRKLPMFDYSYKAKNLPENGIYFFYEEDETYEINGVVTDRIVRIGTCDKDNNFRIRIRNHYKGNKNSSVFRMHIGSAIIKKDKRKDINLNEWMKHGTSTNKDIEELINKTFKEKFRFRCIPIESKDKRVQLEKKLIATLSGWNYPSSKEWIGHYAKRKNIRSIGLWNIKDTHSQNTMTTHDLIFLKEKINSSTPPHQYSTEKKDDKQQTKVKQ